MDWYLNVNSSASLSSLNKTATYYENGIFAITKQGSVVNNEYL